MSAFMDCYSQTVNRSRLTHAIFLSINTYSGRMSTVLMDGSSIKTPFTSVVDWVLEREIDNYTYIGRQRSRLNAVEDNVEQAETETSGRERVYVDCQRRQRRHREGLAARAEREARAAQ